jgi:hypothetical protein
MNIVNIEENLNTIVIQSFHQSMIHVINLTKNFKKMYSPFILKIYLDFEQSLFMHSYESFCYANVSFLSVSMQYRNLKKNTSVMH